MENYKQLEKIFKKLNDIDDASNVLHWDASCMMPSGGAKARMDQLSTLHSISHALLTDESVSDMIDEAMASEHELDFEQKRNLALMKHHQRHASAVPNDLIKSLSEATSQCEMVWRTSKAKSDFKTLRPYLQTVFELKRLVAHAKSEAFACAPYDALLDEHDAGLKMHYIDPLFTELESFLPDFIKHVQALQEESPDILPFTGSFPVEKQKLLATECAHILGFNFDHGRIDESAHPFCSGVPSDVRITTRYNKKDPMTALLGIIHETGHALYEQNLPVAWRGQPLGKACGMTLHESQSLLMEMQVGMRYEFLEYFLPVLQKTLKVKDTSWKIDNIYRKMNHVTPSFIRVDADEVTYPLHIILRYRIEQYIINNDIQAEDLPEAWGQGMRKFLGVSPKLHRDGCMQDIHWMIGAFGYFPSYTLGAMAANQFFDAAQREMPHLLSDIREGNIKNLTDWMHRNIHNKGSLLSTEDLIKEVTGQPLQIDLYKDYLMHKYAPAVE